jgi:hypothetical protein
MVHGDCSSRGCYAMTDEQIQEIYALARESFFGGQKAFQFEAFPFRMTALKMAKHRNNPNFAFWKMLKEGYDHFEATRQEPKVAVCEKHYVFDAVEKNGTPLDSNPRGACATYQLNPQIASAVLEHRRDQQFKMAQYIAEGVATAPPHVGDGGMNPVFADRFGTQDQYDGSGRVVQVATAPGALPHVANPPGTTIPRPASEPASRPVLASVPLPERSPAEPAQPVLRGTKTEVAAKPKAPADARAPVAVAKATAPSSATEESDIRTAYSAPPASNNGMLAGAQPVVPAGTFAGRWYGLR